MKKILNAKITWTNIDEKDRRHFLQDKMYFVISTKSNPLVINSKTIPVRIEGNSWSLVVENKEFISESETIAKVGYLVEEAPDNLHKDVEFELYAGAKLIAEGIIL